MPMKTTLLRRCGVAAGSLPASRRPHTTCDAISPTVRLLRRPIWPVAQKVHPIAQPACDDTQTVTRSRYPIRTASITCVPPSLRSALRVAPRSAVRSSRSSTPIGSAPVRRSRSAGETSDISS